MKIKRANKLPDKDGTYWFMQNSRKTILVYVYSEATWFGAEEDLFHSMVSKTKPSQWSERIEWD